MPEPEPVTIDLTAERLNRGHSIRSLARELDVSEQSIRRLEDGEGVHPSTAKKVADYFEVRVTDIMPIDREAA